MAKQPIDYNIGEDDLKSKPDEIFKDEALPNASNVLSDGFLLGQTLGGVEIKTVCSTAGTLTANVVVELQTSETVDGTYVTKARMTQALGAIAKGDVLAGLILPREVVGEVFAKVKITTTADESAITVDTYPVYLS